MRILSIVHADSDPPGLFAQVASELGHEHDEWRADLRPKPPSEPDTYAAVAVFGGYMSPSDDRRLGWLRTEKGVLGHLIERQVPSLGICLGAQLLAEAAGAKIHPADPPEVGWSEIEVLPQHDEDALFAGLASRLTVFEWLDHAAIDAVAKRIGVDPAWQREASWRHLPASMNLGRRLFTRFLERVADHRTAATDARRRVR
jgi:GMP synthase-like glutamine amidotransferase